MDTQDAEWIAFQSRIHESRSALRRSVTTVWSMNDSKLGGVSLTLR